MNTDEEDFYGSHEGRKPGKEESRMKIKLVLILFFTSVQLVYCQPIELKGEKIIGGCDRNIQIGKKLFLQINTGYIIELDRKMIQKYDLGQLVGASKNNLFIVRSIRNTDLTLSYSRSVINVDSMKENPVFKKIPPFFFNYQNDFVITNMRDYKDICFENLITNEEKPILLSRDRGYGSNPIAISQDKQNALCIDASNTASEIVFMVVNLSSGKILAKKTGLEYSNFVNNNYFFTITDSPFSIRVWDLNGEKSLSCEIQVDGKSVVPISFMNDYKLAIMRNKENDMTYFVDTTPLFDFFDKIGLVFKKTTGTVVVKNATIKENANQSAPNIDDLSQDEFITIFDKSGGKERIGNSYDFWYRIQRNNGKKGWVFGGFIKADGK
jgi:hypothetical protein